MKDFKMEERMVTIKEVVADCMMRMDPMPTTGKKVFFFTYFLFHRLSL